MFGFIDRSKGLLFSSHDLGQILQAALQSMREEVEAIDANRLLNTAPEDLKNYFVQKFSAEPLVLLRDEWYVETEEVEVDVRYDQRRWITDTSRPALVPGERIDVRVPFEGEGGLFYARGSQFSLNPPRAQIDKNELVLRFESASDSPVDVRSEAERLLAQIEQHIEWQRSMIEAHNRSLVASAEQAIQGRRARLLAQSQRVEALGIPVKRRHDVPTTYAVPTIRKKAAPKLPPATSTHFKPEPTWAMAHYEHALKVVQDMSLVMERSPDAFSKMNEEAIRQHFLVQLNAHFESKATAETFNMSGKTDILLREGERNVFIAECKFWKGPKAFREAVDQLMSYATWRDSKTAILVFNRGTDTSTVLAGIDSVVQDYPNFKRIEPWPHESGFRYVLHANSDINRELILTVLLFHVPS